MLGDGRSGGSCSHSYNALHARCQAQDDCSVMSIHRQQQQLKKHCQVIEKISKQPPLFRISVQSVTRTGEILTSFVINRY